MELLINVIILSCFGAITAIIANNKGRSAVGWFFIGFFLGLFGLILVLVLPNLKQQSLRERRLRDENRRLRERVRKDRMVSDQRYRQVNRRIKAHDRVLEIDTDSQDPALQYDDKEENSEPPLTSDNP